MEGNMYNAETQEAVRLRKSFLGAVRIKLAVNNDAFKFYWIEIIEKFTKICINRIIKLSNQIIQKNISLFFMNKMNRIFFFLLDCLVEKMEE